MRQTLTIDPGFKYLGLSRWDTDNAGFLSSHLVTSPPKPDTITFADYKSGVLAFYYGMFSELFESEKVTHIVVERMPFHGATTQRILALMVLGALEVLALHYQITWHEVSAREVKLFVTGNSKATKAVMRKAIAELYPQAIGDRKVTQVPFDEIDSIAVGHMYFHKELNGKARTTAA